MSSTAQASISSGQNNLLAANRGSFAVDLEFFSGPMDLLLHLVARQEVPVEQVKMSLLAEQYLEIVTEQAAFLDLEQASEYLVIAATLLAIKSRSLLPDESSDDDIPGEWDEDNPFFESLRERLIAYRTNQQRASALRQIPQLGVHTFSRVDRKALQPTPEMLREPEDALLLGKLFVGLLDRIGNHLSEYSITLQPISVVQTMVKMVETLGRWSKNVVGESSKFSFFKLINFIQGGGDQNADSVTLDKRSSIIASFIAVLELAKRGVLKAEQGSSTADISLELVASIPETESQIYESEFDVESVPDSTEDDDMSFVDEEEQSEKVVRIERYLSKDDSYLSEDEGGDRTGDDRGGKKEKRVGEGN